MKKIAVLLGGTSSEREVSLNSGNAVVSSLLRSGFQAVALDPAQPDFLEHLINGNFSLVFIALHGKMGEDGCIQGLLNYLSLPFTGCDLLSSALAMDKHLTKKVWLQSNLPTINGLLYTDNLTYHDYKNLLNNSILAIKPTSEGSSVGISKVTQAKEFETAIKLAQQYGQVLIEPWIVGAEVAVTIIDDIAYAPVTIKVPAPAPFYDYHYKYISNDTQYECPSNLPKERISTLQQIALQAFNAVQGRDWARVDFICEDNGNNWLLEINTIPGLTSHSIVPMAAKHAGLSFDALINKLVQLALNRPRTI